MEYPKIQTLFERNEDFSIDPTRIKRPVYSTIKEWDVTEKVDGTNIRVILDPGFPGAHDIDPTAPSVRFEGRIDRAIVPGDLLQSLAKLFPMDKLAAQFQTPVILYGEGYGAGIQKVGKLYRPDKSFILFDVLVGGKWWLGTKAVADVALSLGCNVVPYLGRMTLDEIIGLVQRESWSDLAATNLCPREGIVARPIETLFDSRHERVILKLKTSDFKAGKR